MPKPDPQTTALPWQYSKFFASCAGHPVARWGYIHLGLAMCHNGWASPRSETRWMLTHIGSGGQVIQMIGAVRTVMPVASEIANCSDWTLFDLPNGWRQTDPELPAKVGAICKAHPEVMPDTSFPAGEITDDAARAVMAAMEDAETHG